MASDNRFGLFFAVGSFVLFTNISRWDFSLPRRT